MSCGITGPKMPSDRQTFMDFLFWHIEKKLVQRCSGNSRFKGRTVLGTFQTPVEDRQYSTAYLEELFAKKKAKRTADIQEANKENLKVLLSRLSNTASPGAPNLVNDKDKTFLLLPVRSGSWARSRTDYLGRRKDCEKRRAQEVKRKRKIVEKEVLN